MPCVACGCFRLRRPSTWLSSGACWMPRTH